MFYLILLILFIPVYFFLMPKDVRRSTDIFAIGAVVVLVIAFGVALLFKYHGPIIEIAVVLALLALMIKSILEIENL